jgi:hypothetical protein
MKKAATPSGIDSPLLRQYNVIQQEAKTMPIIQARLSDADSNMVKKYAEAKNVSVSTLIRDSVFEKMEDERVRPCMTWQVEYSDEAPYGSEPWTQKIQQIS